MERQQYVAIVTAEIDSRALKSIFFYLLNFSHLYNTKKKDLRILIYCPNTIYKHDFVKLYVIYFLSLKLRQRW